MKNYLVAATVALLASGASFAQTSGTSGTETPRFDLRQLNLQTRITQGLTSGALTAAEAERLQTGLIRLQAFEDRIKTDGVLTPRERVLLERGADILSRVIARQKADPQAAPPVRRH